MERLRLFVPGARTMQCHAESEWVDNPKDGSFARAFSLGTVPKDGQRAIDACVGARVVYCDFDLAEGRGKAVALVETLVETGAVAVRVEQSKLGWLAADWLAQLSSAIAASWHRAVVVMLGRGERAQSCGMHAFSLPDASGADADLLTALNLYQLTEDPVLLSGQTFSPDAMSPRRVLERWPDVSYPPDSPCHNPFGVWRLALGGKSRKTPELMPVFMPTLAALLTALEKKKGESLTRAEVEAARDTGVCMAMKQRDAQRLERERGYADLDPELVWEQWQALRGSRS